ncbi:pectate lyase family protein [Nocardiopsis halophila]|uniref:pectate lyase family protein n=1 Tax=Nocardiopsis halophila TaxID=141692 RepID=UPI00034A2967|nr:right-handed parallel beta-helix repeat-containing protein [Nocardiopsis halophila]
MQSARTHSRHGRGRLVLGAGAAALGVGAAAAVALALPSNTGTAASPAGAQDTAQDVGSPLADGPVGWAAENGGTTGGDGGETVRVSDAGALLDAVSGDEARVVEVTGDIDLSGMNDVGSNTTIVGDGSAAITGGGFDLSGVENVVIRNLHFADWDDDAVNVQEGSTNVWIDHNSFTGGDDGTVDIKRESDFVTVSWNHVFEHDKSMLLGHSDDHTEDAGHLRVSYHHNFFDGSDTRHPRVRFSASAHVFNNYYVDNAEYGVASTMGAQVLVEGNYFRGVDTPTEVGYGSSGPGELVERGNVYDDSGAPATAGDVEDPPYAYTLDPAEDIPSLVSGGAGPQAR